MKWISTGKAMIIAAAWLTSCTYNEIPTGKKCISSSLTISVVSKTDATTCKSIDGQITVQGENGTEPYDYRMGDGTYQTNPAFDRLGPGIYEITVKDMNNCMAVIEVDIGAANSTLSASASSTPDNQCQAPFNGSITVTPMAGTPPYVVKLDNGAFGAATSFSNIRGGSHTLIVKDAEECEKTLHVTVDKGNTGVSYSAQIVPIMDVSCNLSSCHGAGNTGRDWTVFSNVHAQAEDIKIRTSNKSMPIAPGPALTQEQIDLIACWVDDGAINN